MSNNKENFKLELEKFLDSDEIGMLVTGTHQYQKHIEIMAALNRRLENMRILFRTNAMKMIEEHLGKFVHKQLKSGEPLRIGRNIYEFDALSSRNTWNKTSDTFYAVILYPIDPIARGAFSMESIENLYECKKFKKVFFVSWTDNIKNDYSKFDQYVNRKCIYDAVEEDPEYHERVMTIINRKF